MTRPDLKLWLELNHWVFVLTWVTCIALCWNGRAGRMGWNSTLSFYLSVWLYGTLSHFVYPIWAPQKFAIFFQRDMTVLLISFASVHRQCPPLAMLQQVSLRSALLSVFLVHFMQQYAAMMKLIGYHSCQILPVLPFLPCPTLLPSPSAFQANLLGRTPHRGARTNSLGTYQDRFLDAMGFLWFLCFHFLKYPEVVCEIIRNLDSFGRS